MKQYISHSTIAIKDLPKQPAGTIAFFFIDPDAPPRALTRVQSGIADAGRYHKVTITCRRTLLVDEVDQSIRVVVRAEVVGPREDKDANA